MIGAGKTITRNGCHLFLKHVLEYAFRKKYTTTCLPYDIQKRNLLNMMKCANYLHCDIRHLFTFGLVTLFAHTTVYSLTEWGNTGMAAPSAISFPGYKTTIMTKLLATHRRKSVFRTRVMLL